MIKKTFVTIIFVLAMVPVTLLGATVEVVVDVNGLAASGDAVLTHTQRDIGYVDDCFDGNIKSLMRTANINPGFVQVAFTSAKEITKLRAYLGQEFPNANEKHSWLVEAANTQQDLDNKTGSYVLASSKRLDVTGAWDEYVLPTPITKKIWKFEIERTTGDNYIHITELELTANVSSTGTCGYDEWDPAIAYSGNDRVYYNGGIWRAKWWTRGETPGQAGVWEYVEDCVATPTPTPTPTATPIVNNDLTISYITRNPSMNYVENSTNPAVEGWPAVGQSIEWIAVVKNWFDTPQSINYSWYIDNQFQSSSSVMVEPGQTAEVSLSWIWTFDRHEIKIVLDPLNDLVESEESNNSLMVYSDAISVGFYVEKSIYDYFAQHQKDLNVGSNCYEDWANRQVEELNRIFSQAIYPLTPNGVLDRVRLDKITVVPDAALPLTGSGLPTNHPNFNDKSVDLIWGFPLTDFDYLCGDTTTADDTNAFYMNRALLHELGHARYLIDVYGFNVAVKTAAPADWIEITENGQPIVGTSYMPYRSQWNDHVYYSPVNGLMNNDYTFVDDYSAYALNRIAGHRATKGNYNASGNLGEYIDDLPEQNILVVKDNAGNLLVGADIKIYQAEQKPDMIYSKHYDDIPDLAFVSDTNGEIALGRCPFDENGVITHGTGHVNTVFIVRAEYNNNVSYHFYEATQFNMQYWAGNTQVAYYDLVLDLGVPTPTPTPVTTTPTPTATPTAVITPTPTATPTAVITPTPTATPTVTPSPTSIGGPCDGVAAWDPAQDWTSYSVGDKRVNANARYNCINPAYAIYEPSGPYGHFGWAFEANCN